MSDPVTNVQIEDVLSSIRKLVSEEVRAQSRDVVAEAIPARGGRPAANGVVQTGEGADKAPTEGAKPDGRLILTPALRVDTPAPVEPLHDDQDDSESVADHGAEQVAEARFVHAEPEDEPRVEADLLSLMDRVRAAGAKAATIEEKRPEGISAVSRPQAGAPSEPTSPENAIEAALAALGSAPFDGGRDADVDDTADMADDQPVAEDATAKDHTAQDDTDAQVTPLSMPASILNDDEWLSQLSALGLTRKATDPDEVIATAAAALDEEDLSDEDIEIGSYARSTAPAEDQGDDIVPTFLRHQGITTLRQRVTEVENVVTEHGGDWEPEADEETDAAPGPQAGPVPWIDDEDLDETRKPVFGADADDDIWAVDPIDDPDQAAMDVALAPEATSDVAPEAPAEATARPAIETAFLALTAKQRAAADADRPPMTVVFDSARRAQPAEPAAPEVAASPVSDAAVEPAQSAPETVEADTPTQAEPATDWQDVADQDALDQEALATADREALTEEPVLLDEDMLRDMVSEIVRQELQGALGERITRNVRKLVRREIHRALASYNID
ncbi:hypothetical protein [Pseudooceanicola nitratireducens]|uniref:hypothetical protein n=1 Tax=Pseudooceanicola nitratireducens TaxID=517719 RepID=UPI001C9605E6|nr:hypothetical protein [Pseudooceanicola nitratireducens]MBY6156471.1 hypothetical protein [Pseudooceanicola nitratireducens]